MCAYLFEFMRITDINANVWTSEIQRNRVTERENKIWSCTEYQTNYEEILFIFNHFFPPKVIFDQFDFKLKFSSWIERPRHSRSLLFNHRRAISNANVGTIKYSTLKTIVVILNECIVNFSYRMQLALSFALWVTHKKRYTPTTTSQSQCKAKKNRCKA